MAALTYCAGLRVGELARLRLGDVHLEDDSVEIHNTKFFKSRRLPLTPSVMRVLQQYLAARERAGAPLTRESGLFWSPCTHATYSYVQIRALLTALLRYAGLKPARGRRGPRVHDLRHAFVLNRMLVWYRNGTNPQAHLPYLATYLGHQDISSTLIYLTQTEELQRHANERFRQWRKQAVPLSGEPR
jgi:integrase